MLSTSVKLIFVTSTLAVLLSFAPCAEALHSLFQEMDQNENRKIDHLEYTKNMTKHAFDRLDDNNNNIISKSEWDYIENVKDKVLHNDLYKEMDIDNNSLISYDEFSAYAEKHSNIKETFLTIDKNRDGELIPDEFPDPVRPPFKMVTIQF